MCDFNGRIGGNTPTLSLLDGPPCGGYAVQMLELDSLKQWWQAQVGQFFSMRDVQWGRAWPCRWRLEMLHSYSQELVCGWKNWPTLPQTHWQFKRVKGPLLKLYQIIELRQGDQDIPMWICWPNNPSSLIPLEVCLQKMHLGIAVPTTHCCPIGPLEAGSIIGIRRDQSPQSPRFPSPSPDCRFQEQQEFVIDNILNVIQI